MSKILITATNAMTYHFLIPHINKLLLEGHEISLACTNLEGYDELLRSKIDTSVVELKYIRLDRSPFRLSNYKGIYDLKKIMSDDHYDLIWTNEPVMSIATRLAARTTRKKGTRVMYMVHGFHFFKGSSKISWMIYFPIERIMAHFADCLVTINKEDYKRGKNFAFKDVYYIHGIGLDTERFSSCIVDKNKKREELKIPSDSIVMMSVGELGTRKNHEVAIRGMAKVNNQKLFYIICGEGVLEQKLKDLCKELGIESRVLFLGYRKDIPELCKISDIYVFPSQREGLGIGALEGMASGLPLISSYVNGIRDYTENEVSGYTVLPHDIDSFADAMKALAEDENKRKMFGNNNKERVKQFDVVTTSFEVSNIIHEQLAYSEYKSTGVKDK